MVVENEPVRDLGWSVYDLRVEAQHGVTGHGKLKHQYKCCLVH